MAGVAGVTYNHVIVAGIGDNLRPCRLEARVSRAAGDEFGTRKTAQQQVTENIIESAPYFKPRIVGK